MSIKLERLENEFLVEISKIIKSEVKDRNIDFVTITDVHITKDLSFAKVYVTVLDESKKELIVKTLNKASNFIERELCKRIDVRKMPDLSFVYDESIEYGNKIESIIDNINK